MVAQGISAVKRPQTERLCQWRREARRFISVGVELESRWRFDA